MGKEPRIDAEMAERVVEQAYGFWIGPEIERRQAAGELPGDFALHSAQVVFGMGEGPPEVRLNEEVKAVAEVTAARAIAKGEQVTEDDIAGYKEDTTHCPPRWLPGGCADCPCASSIAGPLARPGGLDAPPRPARSAGGAAGRQPRADPGGVD